MKISLLLLVLNFTFKSSAITSDEIIQNSFATWMEKYGKLHGRGLFPNGYENYKKLYAKASLQKMKFHSGRSKFYLKLNARAVHDHKQVASTWNGLRLATREKRAVTTSPRPNFPAAPRNLDYRLRKIVSPVKNQGFFCSACYAFSANCALESQLAKKYGKLYDLSEQNIVDCSNSYGNLGCEGGFMTASYQYIIKNPGIENSTSYPYNEISQNCQYNRKKISANVTNYVQLTGDEEYIKRALASIGPLSVGMKGDLDSFFYYGGGIFDDLECKGPLNHAVCLIGYGTDYTTKPPTDYWIAKNEWGTDWGEDGYFRILRGVNLCGIINHVIYPIV